MTAFERARQIGRPPAPPEPVEVVPLSGMPVSVDLTPAELDLNLYSADTVTIQFKFVDGNGAAVDMSGTWLAQIRATALDPDPPVAAFTVDATNAATGIIVATLSSTSSATLSPGLSYVWDLEQTTAGGAVRTTHAGKITVVEDVTRP
jgi:hypothetical protein